MAQALDAFLEDREAQGRSPLSIKFYRRHLEPFIDHLAEQHIAELDAITAAHVRGFLLVLQ